MEALFFSTTGEVPEGSRVSINGIVFNLVEKIIPQKYVKAKREKRDKRILNDFLYEDLMSAFEVVRKRGSAPIVLSEFTPIKQCSRCLRLLQESKNINFVFADFPSFERKDIDFLMDFLDYQKKYKSNQSKQGIEKRKKEGKVVGNPEIDSAVNISRARYAKLIQAEFNRDNYLARVEIGKLKNLGYNFNKIARILNEKGFRTRNGKQFYAKGVERFYNKQVEIDERFKLSSIAEEQLEQVRGGRQDKIKVIFPKNNNNFENKIEIKIQNHLNTACAFTIKDNTGSVKYNKELRGSDGKILIDAREQLMLPGVYIVNVTPINAADKIEQVSTKFYLWRDLNGVNDGLSKTI